MDPPDPLIGAVVNGKFRIHRAIARGGMGRIYYATQEPFDRPVALKVVQADTVNEEESQFLRRFLQEASILAKMQHPNVVMLFDYGRIEPSKVERYFIAMEYLDGETLAQRMKARGVLSTPEVLVLMRQIARGLREAHVRGIVHRDLKPSNIILVPEAEGGEIVKIVDFGIGKVVTHGRAEVATERDDAGDLTQEGVMVGTPRYMAPEQFDGAASPASDVYALGTIAFQALAGGLPFRGNTLAEFMVAKLAQPPARLRDRNPGTDAPESLEALIMDMLARAPNERPTLDQLSARLTSIEDEVFGPSQSIRRSAITGSGAHLALAAAGPASAGPLRVPHTIVSSAPQGLNPALMGLTPRPMATSTRPPAPTSRAPTLALVGAAAVLVGLLVGVGVWAKSRASSQASDAPEQPSASTSTEAPIASGPPSATTAATAAPSGAFTLHVDSAPRGARVTEGDHVLGQTPLDVAIDPATVAGGPRTFTVKKDGYASATVVQGPSDANVNTVVSLAREGAPHVKSRGGGRGGGATGGAQKPAGTDGLDIRLNR